MNAENVHGTCILYGSKALLLRGASGIGKSRLAWQILRNSSQYTRLVADDRVVLEMFHDRLIARPANNLAGLLEIRGMGIIPFSFEARAQVSLVVDLVTAEELLERWPRLPEPCDLSTAISGVRLPLIRVNPVDPAAIERIDLAMRLAAYGVDKYCRGLAEEIELGLSNKV